MAALLSGRYDLSRTALLITQTGGGCRATNYISFIRRALEKAGFGHIPVISLSFGLEKNSGFKLSLPLAYKGIYVVVIGDLLMRLINATRPYEAEPGSTDALYQKWRNICVEEIRKKTFSRRKVKKLIKNIVHEFDTLPRKHFTKPRVGVVGEILVKFSPMANNHITDLL